MRCCVFGGAGFIGSWVTKLLVARGREVVAIGRSAAPLRTLPAGVEYVSGTYADKVFLRRVLAGADEIVDLAYSTHPQTSFADPLYDIVDNLPPTVSLLQVATELDIRKVVLVSSGGTIYGIARSVPIAEDHPTYPVSPYGITKLAVEKYGLMFHHVYGLPVSIARPGNAYGEGQTPAIGQGFVAEAIARILDYQAITVFGPRGTIRDYVHVSDVAGGIVAVLERGASGDCYNIGTGTGRSNLEVLDALTPHARSAGYEIRPQVSPPRKFDVPESVLDSSKLAGESGWRPQVGFADGIAKAWRAALLDRTSPRDAADVQAG
jgi:UDP-glucose 4-epimerase